MRVLFTPRARATLTDILDWIARDDPSRALTFVDELVEKAIDIGGMPRAFPVIARYARRELRRRVHGNYLIIYRVLPGVVEILYFIHGARDYQALLDAEVGRD